MTVILTLNFRILLKKKRGRVNQNLSHPALIVRLLQ
jgi:hypothetical protein